MNAVLGPKRRFKFNPYDFDVRYPGSSDRVTVDVTFTLAATP